MSDKLKPCPFCGEEATIRIFKGKNGWRDRYAVICRYDEGGCGAESGLYHSEEEATESWNRRAIEALSKAELATNLQPTCNDAISRQALKVIIKIWLAAMDTNDIDTLFEMIDDIPSAQPERQWIPIWDGDGQMPEVDEDGCSEYVLLSFGNASFVCIGRYQVDEDGGAFYDGDEEDPLTKIGLFVNAWMPLPKPYREEREQDGKKTDC